MGFVLLNLYFVDHCLSFRPKGFLLATVLSVLRITTSGNAFDIFKLNIETMANAIVFLYQILGITDKFTVNAIKCIGYKLHNNAYSKMEGPRY